MIKQELQKVNQDILFRVSHPPIDIKIGECNTLLDELLDRNNCMEWAFVSACNPYGTALNQLLNFRRHESLREKLYHYRSIEGEEVNLMETETSIKGFLVLGIPRSDSAKLGLLFEQNFIVVGRRGVAAEILDLR
ncbi:MAG: DUF3293 domain-containing protein [Bacteroidota bacterium]